MSALAVSQIEKHFMTNEIYKRGRRYFDVIKLNSIEHSGSKSRRKPSPTNRSQIQKKIDQSFMSSEDYYNSRRVSEIQKSKKKHSSCVFVDDQDQVETNCSVRTRHCVSLPKKGYDMSKVLSREFYQKFQQNTSTLTQDPFDNFVHSDFQKGQKSKAIDFNKIIGRQKNSTLSKIIHNKRRKHFMKEQNPQQQIKEMKSTQFENTNKVYQKYAYDQSVYKCLFDIEKQKKMLHRNSLKKPKKIEEIKQIDLQRIQKGRDMTRKKPACSSLMFYYGKGKNELSQIHIRTLKKNQNHWQQQLKLMKEQKEDFQVVKRRQQMLQKRMDQIKKLKHISDIRGEICDAKYFLRLREE